MIKKLIMCIFILQLMTISAQAQNNHQIEIFEIKKGKVTKRLPLNEEIQEEAENYLNEITGVFVKYNPIPGQGFMIKVPLEPNIMVKNQWINDLVDEVVIIFPGDEEPYLMVHDNENNMHFYTFKGGTDKLLTLINYKPSN